MSTLSLSEVKAVVKELLKRYHAEYAPVSYTHLHGFFAGHHPCSWLDGV